MPYIKLTCCKYCSKSFEGESRSKIANHSRWCDLNPKIKEYKTALALRSINQNTGSQRSEETKEKMRNLHKQGRYSHIKYSEWWKGKTHSDETKKLLREKALASPHRRLRKKMIEYNGVLLDSSWELALAKRLDELGVKWTRPSPILWIDSMGQRHHYFPDFYLVDYDLYLDPKNPQAIKKQKDKLDLLLTQYTNIKILYSLDECKYFTV
jgi:hypothetical protein